VLIGCANVANLRLARAEILPPAIAVRSALGRHGPLIRQLVAESGLSVRLLGGAPWVYSGDARARRRCAAIARPAFRARMMSWVDWRVAAFTFVRIPGTLGMPVWLDSRAGAQEHARRCAAALEASSRSVDGGALRMLSSSCLFSRAWPVCCSLHLVCCCARSGNCHASIPDSLAPRHDECASA